MSTYITNRLSAKQLSSKYGGKQEDYQRQSQAIILSCANRFRKAVENTEDLIQLFHNTLAFLGQERHRIAKEHQSENWESFGIRRDKGHFQSPLSLTSLNHQYKEYGNRLLAIIQKHLSVMQSPYYSIEIDRIFNYSPHLNRTSTTRYSILFDDALIKRDESEYQRLCMYSSVPIPNNLSASQAFSQAMKVNPRYAMKNLRKNSRLDYKRFIITLAAYEVNHLFPVIRSAWVHVSNYIQIGNQMFPTTRYLTWFSTEYDDFPVEYMTDRSMVTLLHQDPFLIKTMLDDIAKIFKKAMEWDRQNMIVLKNNLALFQFMLSHAMPFKRGSAAISEWLIAAICGSLGLKISYNQQKFPDLEALTSPLRIFVKNFDSMVKIEPIKLET